MVSTVYRKRKRVKVKKTLQANKRRKRSYIKKTDWLKKNIVYILSITVIIVIISIVLISFFSLSTLADYTKEIPKPNEPFEKTQDITSYIYDRNGEVLYKIHGDQNRELAELDEIPLPVLWAFIAAEDVDFYTHEGIDLGGITKAFLHEAFDHGQPRGGSTITQQMIKNTVLTSERSYERKLKEIILSMQVEQQYTKDEVLKLYLNEIGFGGNTYGIRTAAKVYFGKDVTELTLAEGALLAGLPPAPGLYSPLFAADIDAARKLSKESQTRVLDQIEQNFHKINAYAREYSGWDNKRELFTYDMLGRAYEKELNFMTRSIAIEAPHFVFYVQDELQKGNYNDGKPFTLAEIERGGLQVTTSLDLTLQHTAEKVISNGLDFYVKPHGGNNASLVTIDPNTGQVLAMVGSADYFGSQYPKKCSLGVNCKFEPNVNVAIALRQPGSSIKPLLYHTGFETGQLYPAYPLVDTEIDFGGGYMPRNNSGTFKNAPVTVRQAVRESLNVPAVEAAEIIGVGNFINRLNDFGYTSFDDPKNFGPSIGLGAGEVTLLEHTNAFGVFAQGGIYHPISSILIVRDKDGNVLYDASKDEIRNGKRIANEQSVYLINDVTKFYHYTPSRAGYDFAGKTGTSDNNTNTYYMGWSPNSVTGVWVGNNDNSRMYKSAYGYTTARYLWMDYTEQTLDTIKPGTFTRPGGIVTASVCYDNGLLATGNCSPISDLFIADKLPLPDNTTTYVSSCRYENVETGKGDDKKIERKYICSDTPSRYIIAPKPEWQEYWDRVF